MADSLKLPVFVPVTTRIAASLGLVQSIIGIALYSVAMHMYLQGCYPEMEQTDSVNMFGTLLHHYFFIKEDCNYINITDEMRISETVTPSQIFAWAAVGVSFSSIWLIVSIVVLFYVIDRNIKTVNLVLYTWCITTLCITVVDMTLGIMFGISYEKFSEAIVSTPPEIEPPPANLLDLPVQHHIELLKLASLLLMSISLRGFVMLIINLCFVGIFFWHSYEIHQTLKTQEHSIHSREPINAFSNNKPANNNMWQFNTSEFDPAAMHSGSSSNLQRGFRPEHEDRSTWRSNIERELSNSRQPDSHSWRPKDHSNMAARPFSYLEEPRPVRHPNPVPSPTVPIAMTPPWKRTSNWESTPPVPVPDYSPLQNRKLKSALKPGYNY